MALAHAAFFCPDTAIIPGKRAFHVSHFAFFLELSSVKHPSPALVSQDAVRALPRSLLLLLCVVYVLAGFVGRSPWKNDDIVSYGHMQALAQGQGDWLAPSLLSWPAEPGNWLALWLGAWSIQLAPGWLTPELAARIPFMLLVGISLACTWYACYFLARTADAQPVPFAFGGEAAPRDYARALADGAVLGMIASLGFAQFSHETTLQVLQLAGGSLVFLAFALGFYHPLQALLLLLAGATALLLGSGAHWLLLWGLGAVCLSWWTAIGRVRPRTADATPVFSLFASDDPAHRRTSVPPVWFAWPLLASLVLGAVAVAIGQGQLWFWQANAIWQYDLNTWRSIARLLIWFSWPVWPLCLWALWRWRRQWLTRSPSFHMVLPLWFATVVVVVAVCSSPSDRSLFLGLPVFATLAAFALPTMRRSFASLIDWFTLLFFTACGIAIWVIWVATQTGVPAKPAANVAKLAPEYLPQFGPLAFVLALLATVIWLAVVFWRTGRHQSALWKSLVLPAGGATWCLVLVTTLWLPMLDYGRGYQAQMEKLREHLPASATCVTAHGLSRAQIAAVQTQGSWPLRSPDDASDRASACTWSLVGAGTVRALRPALLRQGWVEVAKVERPTDDEPLFLFRHRQPRRLIP